MTTEQAVPRFAAGVKFRLDAVRDRWVILAPERMFIPDEQAVLILQLIDGDRSLGTIIDVLATRFDAPRDVLAADICAMVQDLADKGALRL